MPEPELLPELNQPTFDPIHQPTPMAIGKKTYLLNFDFEALACAEEKTGISLLFGINWEEIGVKRLEGILQAALAKHQPGISIAEIRSLIKPRNVKKIEAALVLAWFAIMPETDEAEEGNPPQPQV